MSEFFLELFSEEVPAKLQANARKNLLENFNKFIYENEISVKNRCKVFSTPNRMVLHINKIANQVLRKANVIKGPSTLAPDKALEGFIRSNNINKNQVFKKKN